VRKSGILRFGCEEHRGWRFVQIVSHIAGVLRHADNFEFPGGGDVAVPEVSPDGVLVLEKLARKRLTGDRHMPRSRSVLLGNRPAFDDAIADRLKVSRRNAI